MSLTLMPVRVGGLARAGVDARLSGFFSAAHPPIHKAALEMSEVFRKSRRENPGLRFFMALLRGRRLETEDASDHEVIKAGKHVQAACCGRRAVPWNVVGRSTG